MAVMIPKLPKKDLPQLIRNHADSEHSFNTVPWYAKWDLFRLYCQGWRRFEAFDKQTGRWQLDYLDDNGKWISQVHDINVAIAEMAGVFLGMNLMPSVQRSSNSLAELRDSGAANVIATGINDPARLMRTASNWYIDFSQFGTGIVSARTIATASGSLIADHEVVHPREILPFPACRLSRHNLWGYVRTREVDLEKLVKDMGSSIRRKAEKMETFIRRIGEPTEPMQGNPPGYNGYRTYQRPNPSNALSRDDDYMVVRMHEVYTFDQQDQLGEYAMISGDAELDRQDYLTTGDHRCPIHISRFIDSGHFYGLGYCDIVFSLIVEYERMIKRIVNNTSSMDSHPTILIPSGDIDVNRVMREDGTSMRYAMYKPKMQFDGSNTQIRPTIIAPHTASVEVIGRTASFIRAAADRNQLLKSVLENKGRVDSFAGLQVLEQESRAGLAEPVRGAVAFFANIHRHTAGEAISLLSKNTYNIPLRDINLSLVGVKIDWEKSVATFADSANPLPDVSTLQFGIVSTHEASPTARKQEMVALVQNKIAPADRILMHAAAEGIKLEMWMDDIICARDTWVRNIITIYNDGTTPGPIPFNPKTELPQYQTRWTRAFMSSTDFRLASADVQAAITRYHDLLLGTMQEIQTAGVPSIEDILAQSQLPSASPEGTLPS